ncbi:hypothetical protein [Rathayibacter iranicus]|uniref:Uncharacterized protein n=1 Tax=Rathayibacter iranicus NCPPB 2253 = VKM Ac-1602 TaxID=1328868 RepID=A0ABX5LBX1_9MICO|nr:hypothetical protein [Rathayibacter iranicus]MWV32478.1 hypothetical protein [Rathayibacter iranicus NCPPB 2253 = VKM Ac-1602]PWJ61215.1 hypothetical protein B0H03_11952 [Rathayibacter iranicus NCPPB 2253 = VKM Ac-1602]
MIPFDALASRIPLSPVRAALRLDPFHGGMWGDGSAASWVSRERADRAEEADFARLPPHLRTDPGEAWERLDAGVAWNQKLNVLGALDAWRTLTAEQLAALTGEHALASGRHRSISDLFAARLLEIGIYHDALRAGAKFNRGTLLRPAKPSAAVERFEQALTYPEWVSVTGGTGFEFSRQYDRHNVLAAELGLRVAEFCRVAAVLGEKLSAVNDLAYRGWGVPPRHVQSQQTADMTIVRADGLRIAVELTASANGSMEQKMAKWAAVLADRSTADSGLVVLFVIAGRPEMTGKATSLARNLRTHLARAARIFPGRRDDLTASRMFIVSWSDWFPAGHNATRGFVNLRADRPTGAFDEPWEACDLLDPVAVPYRPADTARPLALLDNLAGLRSVPRWQRTGTPPELWRRVFQRKGIAELPRIASVTDDGTRRGTLGAARGAVGPTRPVKRMVFSRPR